MQNLTGVPNNPLGECISCHFLAIPKHLQSNYHTYEPIC